MYLKKDILLQKKSEKEKKNVIFPRNDHITDKVKMAGNFFLLYFYLTLCYFYIYIVSLSIY